MLKKIMLILLVSMLLIGTGCATVENFNPAENSGDLLVASTGIRNTARYGFYFGLKELDANMEDTKAVQDVVENLVVWVNSEDLIVADELIAEVPFEYQPIMHEVVSVLNYYVDWGTLEDWEKEIVLAGMYGAASGINMYICRLEGDDKEEILECVDEIVIENDEKVILENTCKNDTCVVQ